MFGAIETGGTKTVCAVGEGSRIDSRARFPTGDDPVALVNACAEFFAGHAIEALGVGTFGPCDLNPASLRYGRITSTPKPGWADTDLLSLLASRIDAPTVMTTDVTAAALGEFRRGAGAGTSNLVYLTIGTGVGGGAIIDSRPVHGMLHPEMGHMLLPQSHGAGVCPYHGNCLEGLVSGPALQHRLGRPAQDFTDDHPVWDDVADTVAVALHNITLTLSCECIVVGGGVGSRDGLHRRLPALLQSRLNAYVPVPRISAPGLGWDSGVVGALLLAESAR
jgi:fructokinase